jgi:hypothetical protein
MILDERNQTAARNESPSGRAPAKMAFLALPNKPRDDMTLSV